MTGRWDDVPASVRTYQTLIEQRARVRSVAQAVFDGCFLGAMDPDALAALDRLFYAHARESVDGTLRLYEDEEHIRSGLAAWELAAVQSTFPPGGTVVVTSAGAGREVLALLELGYDAFGFEPNDRLVAAGRRVLASRGADGRLRLSERDRFPIEAPSAEAVIVGWGSYMLIPGRARRIALLRGARAILRQGSPLLASFHIRPAGRYFSIVHGIARMLRRLRGAEGVELGDALHPSFAHYFTSAEIRGELAEGGFECVELREKPYGHVIARAV